MHVFISIQWPDSIVSGYCWHSSASTERCLICCNNTRSQQYSQILFFSFPNVFSNNNNNVNFPQWINWLPDFKHLVISCSFFCAGATCLYFPQKEYTETVYVGQQAGTPLLQVHAMLDSASEKPHFYLCSARAGKPPPYSSWFYMDINTGTLFLNRTLEESDFAQLSELDTSLLMVMYSPISLLGTTRE